MKRKEKKIILIAGVGNKLRRDDGIGLVIMELLEQQQKFSNENVTLLNAGTDGFMLLDAMEQYEKIIIIDAVDMQQQSGTLKTFTPKQVKILIKQDALSTHGFGLAEIIRLSEKLDLKTQIEIIGVQPQDTSFGEELTVPVRKAIPEILNLLEQCVYG